MFVILQRNTGCMLDDFGRKAMIVVCSKTHIVRTSCGAANALIINSACFRRSRGDELFSENDQLISFVHVGN